LSADFDKVAIVIAEIDALKLPHRPRVRLNETLNVSEVSRRIIVTRGAPSVTREELHRAELITVLIHPDIKGKAFVEFRHLRVSAIGKMLPRFVATKANHEPILFGETRAVSSASLSLAVRVNVSGRVFICAHSIGFHHGAR